MFCCSGNSGGLVLCVLAGFFLRDRTFFLLPFQNRISFPCGRQIELHSTSKQVDVTKNQHILGKFVRPQNWGDRKNERHIERKNPVPFGIN